MAGDGASKVDLKSLPAYVALTKKFGQDLKLPDLSKLADDAVMQLELQKPKGDAKKSIEALYQWFQANWDAISSILDDLSLDADEEDDDDDDDEDDDDE
jgi:hypothetical protein